MAKHRQKSSNEETSYWLSYSDMMAGLLLVFILIITFTMLQSRKMYEDKEQELLKQQKIIEEQKIAVQEQEVLLAQQKEIMADQQNKLDKIIGVRTDLVQALKNEFEGTALKVKVDSQTGAITLDSNVLFDSGKYVIKTNGYSFLDEFLPRYLTVLLDNRFKEYVSEIIIEDHTDTVGGYEYNLELSQQRALSVAKYCTSEKCLEDAEMIEQLKAIMTANGRSFSNPIYFEDGSVDKDASRRVEFKFRLKDEDMIAEMIDILNAEG